MTKPLLHVKIYPGSVGLGMAEIDSTININVRHAIGLNTIFFLRHCHSVVIIFDNGRSGFLGRFSYPRTPG